MYSIQSRNSNTGIYDRSPFSVLLYSIILDKFFDLSKLCNVFDQIANLGLIKPNEKFLILLPKPENFPLVLELMIKRRNNIDELTIDYISRQTTVFHEFAKYFKLPTFFVDHSNISDSLNILHNNVTYLFNSTIYMSRSLEKSYPSDAAYDLTLSSDYTILPHKKATLCFNERIVIPINYAGFLCARSSINILGALRIGLIDATFNGQLSAVFKADDAVVGFQKDQRVAQLVIFPIGNRLPTVVSSLLPSLLRGEGSFGSTGQF